jgi:predicted dehydrogenase
VKLTTDITSKKHRTRTGDVMIAKTDPIGCAVIGYGPTYNIGKLHSRWIRANDRMKLCAVCDRDPARTQQAEVDFPGVKTFNETIDLYSDPDIELVTVATPNFTHCALVKEALTQGRHVLTENAMCLDVAEANEMVEAAQEAGKMLAVHHNRRHDGNYRRIKQIIDAGTIGDIFQIELTHAKYRDPFERNRGSWWANRNQSGGSFFYYGAQAIDWILDLIPSGIAGVTGFCHENLVWHEMTDEDQVRAVIRFENGVIADFTESHIDAAPKPFWRILGTRGAIVDYAENAIQGYQTHVSAPPSGSLELITVTEGGLRKETVPYLDSVWYRFYEEIADHLLAGAPIPVDGECGRRVMGVIEAAKESAATGRTQAVPFC